MYKTIVIIGAGPIGCYAASLLSAQGHDVSVYEEHAIIGTPIQCTGLLTGEFDTLDIPKDDFLVNTFEEISVKTKNKELTVKQKEYLVCRTKFDQYFARCAKKAGAKIHTSHSFMRKEKDTLLIKNLNTQEEMRVTPDIVIAADGPLSKTIKAYGFYEKSRKQYYGIQAVVKGDFSKRKFETYFGKEICPDLFIWVVPETDTQARVGLASKKNTRTLFDAFMKKQNYTVLEMQAGTIPIYNPKQKIQEGNCYAIGDAAGFVKATTLGGLIPGLKAAKILAECITSGKNFHTAVAPIRRKLRAHLIVRKMFDTFSDADWDKLLTLVGQKRVQKVFEKYSRDNPLPLITHTILREPRFLWFTKNLF